MLTQIYNGHILTPQGWIDGGSVLIENGLITEVRKSSNIDPNADKTIDAKGLHVVPGGIELHCHGGGGSDFMEGTEQAFRQAVKTHMQHGTTAIFPTLSSSTAEMMDAACHTCDQLMHEPGTPIMGLHLEGPTSTLARLAPRCPKSSASPTAREYQHFIEDFDCVRRWDVAPALPGALEFGQVHHQQGRCGCHRAHGSRV